MPSIIKPPTLNIEENILLNRFSTFGIGGKARYFAKAETLQQLQELLLWSKEKDLPFLVIGKGSNSLFDDKGFIGLIILNKITHLEKKTEQEWSIGAGYSFSLLGINSAKEGLSGLEFASGIPGSVGGAIFMNAGAGGKEVCQALKEVVFIDENGEIKTFLKEELVFSYRHSSFQEKKGAIASATFLFTKDPNARDKQKEMIAYRKKTQPYGEKSCGCVFRNPDIETGKSAGALIESCGLKKMRIGGAEVSELHANFIINPEGTASADEVLKLAFLVQTTVKEQTGISLAFELRKISYDGR